VPISDEEIYTSSEEEKEEEEEELSLPPSLPPATMSQSSPRGHPQQQQQQNEPTPEQMMYYLAQQATAIQRLLQNGAGGIEVAKPPIFEGEREKVVGFINACRLYAGMKLGGWIEGEKISWMLLYVQEGMAEVWKENILEEIMQGMSVVITVEELFTKMRSEFGEFDKQSRKVDELRMLEQESRTCNEYVQLFKKTARESGYEERSLVEEFKRGLNGNIRRRLAEVESLPSTITEWQERAVKLDRNIRQSRAEKRVLEGEAAAQVPLGPNAQHQGGQKPPWGQSSRGGFNVVRGSGFRPQWNSGGFRSTGFQKG